MEMTRIASQESWVDACDSIEAQENLDLPTETAQELTVDRSTSGTLSAATNPIDDHFSRTSSAMTTPTMNTPTASEALSLVQRYPAIIALDSATAQYQHQTKQLSESIQSISNEFKANAELMKAENSRLKASQQHAAHHLSLIQAASRSYTKRAYQQLALASTAIATCFISNQLAKGTTSTNPDRIDAITNVGYLLTCSHGLYRMATANELTVINNSFQAIINGILDMGRSGFNMVTDIIDSTSNTLSEIGDLAAGASETANATSDAIGQLRGDRSFKQAPD